LGETTKRLLSVLPAMDIVIVGGGVGRSWRFIVPALRQVLTGVAIPVIGTRRAYPALRGAAALFV